MSEDQRDLSSWTYAQSVLCHSRRVTLSQMMVFLISELDLSVLPNTYQGTNINMKHKYNSALDPYKNGAPHDVLLKQAHRYREWFETFLQYPSITRVTFWGYQDGMSWKNDFPMKGRTDYPLVFDRNLQPKPVHDVLIDLVQAKNQ